MFTVSAEVPSPRRQNTLFTLCVIYITARTGISHKDKQKLFFFFSLLLSSVSSKVCISNFAHHCQEVGWEKVSGSAFYSLESLRKSRLKPIFSKAISDFAIIILAVIPGGQMFSCAMLGCPCSFFIRLSALENQARHFNAQNIQLWKYIAMEIYSLEIFPKVTKISPIFEAI